MTPRQCQTLQRACENCGSKKYMSVYLNKMKRLLIIPDKKYKTLFKERVEYLLVIIYYSKVIRVQALF